MPGRLAKGATLAAVLVAIAIAFADSSIVVIALPDVLRRFDASIASVAWVVTAYNLALALGALALVAAGRRTEAALQPRSAPLPRVAANGALALVSAALVGLLFLAVVLLIDVWRLSPLVAAAVVSAIPLATVAAQPLATRAGSRPAAAAGVVLLAAGLGGMGLLPARSIVWAAISLSVSGAGLG